MITVTMIYEFKYSLSSLLLQFIFNETPEKMLFSKIPFLSGLKAVYCKGNLHNPNINQILLLVLTIEVYTHMLLCITERLNKK